MFAEINKQKEFEKKLKELEIRNESLDESTKDLMAELDVKHEQLTAFIENPDNFSEVNWQGIQEQKQKLDEKLQLELSNIRDPKKAEKAYKDRRIDVDWLYVK